METIPAPVQWTVLGLLGIFMWKTLDFVFGLLKDAYGFNKDLIEGALKDAALVMENGARINEKVAARLEDLATVLQNHDKLSGERHNAIIGAITDERE